MRCGPSSIPCWTSDSENATSSSPAEDDFENDHGDSEFPTYSSNNEFYRIMKATAQKKVVPNKVLVTGASGLVGVAAIEKFLSAGWEVVGVSRRKPALSSGRDVEFLSVDLRNEEAAVAAFEPLTDITHIAYTALHEKPELVAGWSSKEQIETNNAMLRNV